VAVARRELEQNGKARTAVVLCGSNISADKLRTILG
jgi:hypothetical protein